MTSKQGAPLTGVDYWQAVWGRIGQSSDEITPDSTFDRLLKRFLPVSSNWEAMEIGCYPGTYLLQLGSQFGYRMSGIDFVPEVSKLREPLEAKGVRVGQLIQADFLQYESKHSYDVVASFGFVEHFENLELLLTKHAALVKPGGLLIVEVPHFRGLHYWLRRGLEPELLTTHNLRAMVPSFYRDWLDRNGFSTLYCNYFMTFDFWLSSSAPLLTTRIAPKHRAVVWASRLAKIALRRLHLEHVPNPWFSPYIVVVARKVET